MYEKGRGKSAINPILPTQHFRIVWRVAAATPVASDYSDSQDNAVYNRI